MAYYYYPIKCPYCLKVHNNETIRFDMRTAMETARRVVSGTNIQKVTAEVNEDEDLEGLAGDVVTGGAQSSKLPNIGLLTIGDLKGLVGDGNVEPIYRSVNALPSLVPDSKKIEFTEDVLLGVKIKSLENGVEVERSLFDRCCDCGDPQYPRKFNIAAGTVPMYVVLMMGSSSAGKTIYLLSLYHALSDSGGYALPPHSPIAKLYLSGITDNTNNADTAIAKMADELFYEGKLPPTTINLTNEPLTLDINFRVERTNTGNRALLYLRDIPGEYLTNPERQTDLFQLTAQFPLFDGFMIMFDPKTFRNTVFGADVTLEQRRYIDRLKQIIVNNVRPVIGDKIPQPTSAVITKGDLFTEHLRELMLKGVSASNETLAPRLYESFDRDYFYEINRGTREILERLSPNVLTLLDGEFANYTLCLVSSLSRQHIDIEGERVLTPNAINPWRVVEPMLQLLMHMHIIPPFDLTGLRTPPAEKRDALLARQFRNRKLINDWGNNFCTGWIEL